MRRAPNAGLTFTASGAEHLRSGEGNPKTKAQEEGRDGADALYQPNDGSLIAALFSATSAEARQIVPTDAASGHILCLKVFEDA